MIAQNTPHLNSPQEKAVQAPDQPLLIVAGAGTGKTRTLTMRILHLLKRGVPSGSICALTFTNKAAREIEERVLHTYHATPGNAGKGWPSGEAPFLGTFHSFGARILRKECRLFGRTPDFVIFDTQDTLQVVKKAMKNLGMTETKKIRGKDQGPAFFADRISRIKNGMSSPRAMLDNGVPEDELAARIFIEYEKELEKNNAFDFDDLIEKVVSALRKHPEVLAKYQQKYSHFLVDEYQDVNNLQAEMMKLLASHTHNISVVGDDHQCLPPETRIETPQGTVQIKDIRVGDVVTVAAGNGMTHAMPVEEVKKFNHTGTMVVITTRTGRVLNLTPNHIIFLRHQLAPDIFYVYLMYRADKGFRIGMTKGTRSGQGSRSPQLGLVVRGNQERADKMWVVKICRSRTDAEYWEMWYSLRYQIPTLVFDAGNRSMKMSQEQIDQFFASIDSWSGAERLAREEHLYLEYPHWLPQGGARFSHERIRVRIALFDDRRKSVLNPWGMSRLSINTRNDILKENLEAAGYQTRVGKTIDWRMEIANMDYGALERTLDDVCTIDPSLEVDRTACLTSSKRFDFQPAAHARATMLVGIREGDTIIEDVIESVDFVSYDGMVYDLTIPKLHNYIAEGIVVHNSIYSWRGSNPDILLNFERDWPNAQVVVLDQNYRSSQNIISAASAMIANNRKQKPKTLWTENAEGEKIRLIEAIDDEDEAEWVANELLEMVRKGTENPLASSAILYRANAQSRAIEQALLRRNIPYSVYGGLKFYERKEIRDVVAGLRYALNPNDEVSKERLEKSLNKTRFRAFAAALAELMNKNPDSPTKNPAEIIKVFLMSTDYFSLIERNLTNGIERRENIAELLEFASEFENLARMMEEISLVQSTDAAGQGNKRGQKGEKDAPRNGVQLMTMHLAKGLEFDTVFIVGATEGLLPHARSIESEAELEEERRLLYVAMTRARKQLAISFFDIPSRFLSEIPDHFMEFKSVATGDGNFVDLEDEERYISY